MESGMISVDRWSEGSQVYFLTHLHADHTSGLSATWKKGPLFCSRTTAKLFPVKFPGFELSLLRVLDIGCWHSISLVSPSSGSEINVDFMAVDAHHCPVRVIGKKGFLQYKCLFGMLRHYRRLQVLREVSDFGAVMFLFRGEFGYVLYTGDFRWEKRSQRAHNARAMLLNAIGNDKIDVLYLDNTYCNPAFSFPSREVAAQQVVEIIASHPEHDIIIGVDSLGKEDLLLYVSRALEAKIWVWPERLQIMHLLGFHDIFTTKTSQTRIRAVPRYSFGIETLEGLNTMRATIGIMPSGLLCTGKFPKGKDSLFDASTTASHTGRGKWHTNVGTCHDKTKMNGHLRNVERYHPYIYSVPYSDHACFAEIQDLVKLLQPTNMKGIVSSSPSYVDPLYYLGHLSAADEQSWRLKHELEMEDRDRVEAYQMKSASASLNSTKAGRKRSNVQVHFLGVRVSRVNSLRRVQRGVKMSEVDCPD